MQRSDETRVLGNQKNSRMSESYARNHQAGCTVHKHLYECQRKLARKVKIG